MTLLEILISVSILVLIVSISTKTFTSFFSSSQLDQSVQGAISILEKAKEDTIGGKGGNSYGVHFATTSITIFSGNSYVSGTNGNIVQNLPNGIEVSSINLLGSDANVVFSPISGETSSSGTIVFLNTRDNSTSTIRIYATGVVKKE